ncbi:MAG: putative selenate ABC transporter substrate-binding protein, partial [Halofilum sp. (in: g-proteobacteria)]
FFTAPATATKTLVFTAIPDQDETALRERFNKVSNYLEAQLDVEVRYVPVKSYAAAVTAFRNNQVQLAWFGGLSGVRARAAVPNSRAIAQGIEDTRFRTYFIAHDSAGLEPGDDFPAGIEGKTFTFGSKGSTSGRLMPEFYIRQHFGQAPSAVFERVGFSGSHSRTAALVASGTYQVGALNFQVWKNEVGEGKIDTENVEVIWKTPTYPDYQWTIRGDVDERFGDGFSDRVQAALLSMEDPALLKSFPRSGFIEADNGDYERIRETAEQLDLVR